MHGDNTIAREEGTFVTTYDQKLADCSSLPAKLPVSDDHTRRCTNRHTSSGPLSFERQILTLCSSGCASRLAQCVLNAFLFSHIVWLHEQKTGHRFPEYLMHIYIHTRLRTTYPAFTIQKEVRNTTQKTS